jgi:hypothetical protein
VSWAIITITMSRLLIKIRRPRRKQVEDIQWPTGDKVTTITVTTTDGDISPGLNGMPRSQSSLDSNDGHFHSRAERGDQQQHRELIWSGEVFKHDRWSLAVPLHLNTVYTIDSRPFSSNSSHTLLSSSTSTSSSRGE